LKLKQAALEIDLVSNNTIRSLNKKFLNKNKTTDVLAFQLDETAEIVISVDAARGCVKKGLAATVSEEIKRYIIHGMLHLAGYNDHKPKEQARMFKKQEKLLNELG